MPCTTDGAPVLPLGGATWGQEPGSQDVVLGVAALFQASPPGRSARGLARGAVRGRPGAAGPASSRPPARAPGPFLPRSFPVCTSVPRRE